MKVLTRRQREIFNFLRDHSDSFACPPSLEQLCAALGMASRGSLYKHIMALIAAGLVEPFQGNKQGGGSPRRSSADGGLQAGTGFTVYRLNRRR